MIVDDIGASINTLPAVFIKGRFFKIVSNNEVWHPNPILDLLKFVVVSVCSIFSHQTLISLEFFVLLLLRSHYFRRARSEYDLYTSVRCILMRPVKSSIHDLSIDVRFVHAHPQAALS